MSDLILSTPSKKSHRHGPSMMVLLAVGLLLFIGWAATFHIDQGVRATGQVMSSAHTQIIQAVDGGVLSELRVTEGQHVKLGEVLAVLEKSRAEAGFEESRDKVASLTIAMTRARAESRLQAPVFAASYTKDYPEFVSAQLALYQQRKRTLDEDLKANGQGLSMAREELNMTEALLKDGDVSQLEALRARRQVTEIEARMAASRNKYRQDASAEAAKTEEDLASVNSKLTERKNILEHTELSAPVAGVVKFLRVTTIGGVLRGGDELMQIAPTDDDPIIEAKVNPSDVGQLSVGLPVSVKIDAFDYSVYGMLSGDLVYVSPDTLSETGQSGQTQTYYRVKVHLPRLQPHNPKANDIVVKPGMTASIDIRTGTRSVLGYIAKPTIEISGGANLDLTQVSNAGAGTPNGFSRINSIEIIDLKTDTAANTLKLRVNDVIDMSGFNTFNSSNTTLVSGAALAGTVSKHQVAVYGNALDTVDVGIANWTNSGTVVNYAGHNLVVYNSNTGASQLLIEQAMVTAGHVI